MGLFDGPFFFFWIFAGVITLAYHAYFFWRSVIKVDRLPPELPVDLPENILRFPDPREHDTDGACPKPEE
ncbi:MAG: hypothetical protein VXZ96_14995 [Myxococcota bacterium]|nr:hypothetical protein [Myxococcota bacterium]MEC8381636.1 hypothetical protein [Myxococcota bacterium]